MYKNNNYEVWLRGPVSGVPLLLQPVAHALLQAREEVETILKDFDNTKLWEKPNGVASVGFHLQHMQGVLDRLFTYARRETLNEEQNNNLLLEGIPNEEINYKDLIEKFNIQIDSAIDELRLSDEKSLTSYRGVGRKQLPSTLIGLYTHAAEHTMRHLGQLLVTTRILR